MAAAVPAAGIGQDVGVEFGVEFGAVDAVVRVGEFVVRRAQPSDAAAYCQADAEMVGATYGYTMPPAFAQQRLDEVPRLSAEREVSFGEDLATEAGGVEPPRRTWIAWRGSEVGGIAVSMSSQPEWERNLGIETFPGISLQLNHLYAREWAHGSGLGQALLDLAIPGRAPAYLWLVGGNERAERFYSRNGFQREPVEYSCGPIWYERPLHRLYRSG